MEVASSRREAIHALKWFDDTLELRAVLDWRVAVQSVLFLLFILPKNIDKCMNVPVRPQHEKL